MKTAPHPLPVDEIRTRLLASNLVLLSIADMQAALQRDPGPRLRRARASSRLVSAFVRMCPLCGFCAHGSHFPDCERFSLPRQRP